MSTWSGIRKRMESEYLAESLKDISAILRHLIADPRIMRAGRL